MNINKMTQADFPKKYKSFLGRVEESDNDKAFCQWASQAEIASEFGVSDSQAFDLKRAAYGQGDGEFYKLLALFGINPGQWYRG
jgi:hypothetical protein